MSKITPVITNMDMVTAYGWGIEPCIKGILSQKTALTEVSRFNTDNFSTNKAGIISDIAPKDESLVIRMLSPLLSKAQPCIPADASLFLSSVNGEIEYLERYLLNKISSPDQSGLNHLLKKVKNLCAINGPCHIISAACASSTAAIAYACSMIRSQITDCVLIVAVDCVSEFIFAGFSSLMALCSDKATPFDKDRDGLSIGEAAGLILLMSRQRAIAENRTIHGQITGWGVTNDAVHITAPCPTGENLSLSIKRSLDIAGIGPEDIGSVCAHGTGTIYNDAAELAAFKLAFVRNTPLVYSIKGAIGHTMGAAGLIETIIALEFLKAGIIPRTINMTTPDEQAIGWVSTQPVKSKTDFTLSTNSGFGGINASLILKNGN